VTNNVLDLNIYQLTPGTYTLKFDRMYLKTVPRRKMSQMQLVINLPDLKE
jgi:hypothetical protein